MLNGRYCGNCSHWIDTRPTKAGKVPYFGTCELGRPIKKGEYFNHTVGKGENRQTYKARHADFKVRTDKSCKQWEAKQWTEQR